MREVLATVVNFQVWGEVFRRDIGVNEQSCLNYLIAFKLLDINGIRSVN